MEDLINHHSFYPQILPEEEEYKFFDSIDYSASTSNPAIPLILEPDMKF